MVRRLGGKLRRRPPTRRDEYVEELQKLRFPKAYAALPILSEKLEERLDEDESDESDDVDVEQRLEARIYEHVQGEWNEAAGLTRDQHDEMRAMLLCRRELTQLPLPELVDIYNQEAEKAAPFNRESAKGDLLRWAQVDGWELPEGVLLLLGRNPWKVRPEDLDEWRGRSRFVDRFDELLLSANRAKQLHLLAGLPRPSEFIGWAWSKISSEEAAAVSALREAVMRSGGGRTLEQLEAENAALKEEVAELSSEVQLAAGNPKPTFYKIVYLLAAGKKEEFTHKDVSTMVSTLLAKAPHHDLTADDEPVRNALKEAIAYVARQAAKRK
jgi:hypothetical protein